MPEFLKSLSRQVVVRIIAAYLMVGWVIMQIGEIMVPALNLPEWVNSALAFMLILGFPVVVLLGWMYHIAVRDAETPNDGAIRAGSNRQLDYVILAGLGLVAVIFGLRFLDGGEGRIATTTPLPPSFEDAVIATPDSGSDLPAVADDMRKAIAILPFADRSFEQNQAYFSDGITEEIRYALTSLSSLKVTSRSSSFAYRDSTLTIQEIGKALQVNYILEGSVRKQDKRIRITTQLTDAQAGYSIWSYSYDRTVEDIFNIQEEIARSIADALKVVLSDEEETELGRKYTENQEAYTLYLQGRGFQLKRMGNSMSKAIELYEQAIGIDPEYARAMAGLAVSYASLPAYEDADMAASLNKAETYAQRALLIDPQQAEAFAALGQIYTMRRNYPAMEEAFTAALRLDENDVTARQLYAVGLMQVGRMDDAQEQFRLLERTDPTLPFGPMGLGLTNIQQGNIEEGKAWAIHALNLNYPLANWYLGEAAGLQGNTEEAAEKISGVMQYGLVRAFDREEARTLVSGFYDDAAATAVAWQVMNTFLAENDTATEPQLPYFLIRLGDPEKGFAAFLKRPSPFAEISYGALWAPTENSRKARQHPAFKAYAEEVGLVSYWQKYGWPDKCQPSGNSFKCE